MGKGKNVWGGREGERVKTYRRKGRGKGEEVWEEGKGKRGKCMGRMGRG